MKKLLFIILSICSLKSFSQSNGQIAVYTGASSTTGYSSLTFSTGGGFPALHLGTYSSGGNAFNMGDSVNSGYLVNTLNEWNGTSAFSGYTAQNNLRHTVAMEITSSNYTGAGDVAYFASSAAGGFDIQAQATPITLLSVGGVIPVKVTTTQMNAISSPVDGQTIYNTTTHDYWVYENTTWTEQIVGGVAGNNKEVQFNNSGVFGSSANFTYDNTQNQLTSPHFIGSGAVPTVLGGSLGTNITSVTINQGSDNKMKVTVVTSGAVTGGTTCTITYGQSWKNGTEPLITVTPYDLTTAIAATKIWANGSSANFGWGFAAAAAGTYKFNLQVGE